jgi:uncharacterized protein (DUF697 family)
MIVLTKAQAILVYKLGLALGLSLDWQYYVGEFGSVVGGGFLWRQLARSLVGFIPVWGIVPKVAVAYSGTYVVGQVVLQWYFTGRHLTRKRMRQLSRQAFEQGRTIASGWLKQTLRRGKNKTKALPAETGTACAACGAGIDPDSNFCKNCGQPVGGL